MTAPVASTKFSPYSSAATFFEGDVSWVPDPDDKERIKAYQLYDKMYWNEPGWAKLFTRGESQEDFREINLPSSSKVIEAINRFLGLDFGFNIPKEVDPDLKKTAQDALDAFFDREQVRTKFIELKRGLLKFGDYLWHITADDTKEAGKRLSLHLLEPSTYFPIQDDPEFPERVTGCHLVEVISDPREEGNDIVKRQTYRREIGPDGVGRQVFSSLTYWEVDAWDDRTQGPEDLKQVTDIGDLPTRVDIPLKGITAIPVYHFTNIRFGDHPFGVSELRGLENLIAALNQSISDEDLALVMQGLGVYWTDAGPPENEDGDPVQLDVSPAHVLELPAGSKIGRLNGVSSVAPMIEHMNYMAGDMMSSRGVSDIAAGKVDVAVAESGVSLFLQLAPLLSKNAEKELALKGKAKNFLYDLLNEWFPNYEDIATAGAVADITFRDPLPVNREKVINEVTILVAAGLITTEMAIAKLTDLGWVYPENAASKLLEEKKAKVAAETPPDPFGDRAQQETSNRNEDE